MTMQLGRIAWTPIKPLYPGAEMQVTYGSINGLKVLFVMGHGDGWNVGPQFNPGDSCRALRIMSDRCHPSMESAKRAGRRLMELYLSLITVKKEEE
jgi:hypothetical protein